MSLSVTLASVRKMLKKCAPGAEIEEKLHHHWVRYNGKTFRSLSIGVRGSRDPEVEIGIVVGMMRHLEIDQPCARREIPQLPRKPKN